MKHRNLKSDGIRRLVYEYPSHDFVIDLEEAREVYERASLPTPTLLNIVKARTSDLMTPKSGPRILVDMLTSAGISMSTEASNATKSGTQTAANNAPAAKRPQSGNSNGAQRPSGRPA